MKLSSELFAFEFVKYFIYRAAFAFTGLNETAANAVRSV